jgi:hypothetical protein
MTANKKQDRRVGGLLVLIDGVAIFTFDTGQPTHFITQRLSSGCMAYGMLARSKVTAKLRVQAFHIQIPFRTFVGDDSNFDGRGPK